MTFRFAAATRRFVSAGLAGTLALFGAMPAAPTTSAAAQGTVVAPLSPADPNVAHHWVAETSRPGEDSQPVDIELIDVPKSPRPGDTLTLTVRLTNHSDQPIEALEITPQRAEAATDLSEVRNTLAGPSAGFGYYGRTEPITDLDPGEQREITVSVATDPHEESTLSITESGVYPVLLSLLGSDPATGSNRLLTTERFLLNVSGEGERSESPAGLTVMLPVTADVNITPGETGEAPQRQPLVLANDQLASELAPDGRLTRLLEAFDSSVHRDATCLAVDPELIDVADRMSRGYAVAETRPQPDRPKRLRDSWSQDSEDEAKTPGRGAEDAAAFVDKLSSLAADACLISLPWANAELDAVSATQDPWLMREAVERGPATLNRVLGTPGETNTVITPTGYVSPTTADDLGWADHSGSEVATAGMSTAWETATTSAAVSPEALTPPVPATPVRVLVADNTVFAESAAGRFSPLDENITGVGYNAALAATLAGTGEHPVTVGYSNPQSRYDLTLDSPLARDLTATAALRLATAGDQPVLAMLPSTVTAATAQRTLAEADALFDSGRAHPQRLADYLTPSPEQAQQVIDSAPLADAEASAFGSPFVDPGVYSDPEILATSQQARYTDDLTRILSNDPVLALTRYSYTLPLRRDQLRSLSASGRHAATLFDARLAATTDLRRGNGAALSRLREAIVLLPPGNVYTRTSDSSPLLIVAENRLPLPVKATIGYASTAAGARLSTPSTVRIPASGSITVQMTADLPENADRTDLRLWLATGDGTQISAPVDITVQTRGGRIAMLTALALLGLVVAAAVGMRFIRRGQKRRTEQRRPPPNAPPPPRRPRP